MFIQMFCYSKQETEIAVNILNLHIQDKKFRLELMQNIKSDFFNAKETTDLSEVNDYINNNLNEELDNVGVYYNSGDYIYIRIFKEAKVNTAAYKGNK